MSPDLRAQAKTLGVVDARTGGPGGSDHSGFIELGIESLALMDVYGRVARVLIDFAKPDAQGRLVIVEKVSRQDVAKMIGASREMVSRVIKDLEDRGFIQVLPDGSSLIRERLSMS